MKKGLLSALICFMFCSCQNALPININHFLDESVTTAILEQNDSKYIEGEFNTESHVVLGTIKNDNLITVYAMVLYLNYGYDNGDFKVVSGGHMPVALTFYENKNNEYSLYEYWQPEDGEKYSSSIKSKFPKSIYEQALDTQKYIEQQQAECDAKAQQYLISK
ncbi:MAG: hypothetical protein PHX02_07425 [Oscillospiraceae bacterium]|nr:hypothetical protein [Oscillospiraceae bacterium]